jgi:D-alanyl-D-alanine carboxypeptidase
VKREVAQETAPPSMLGGVEPGSIWAASGRSVRGVRWALLPTLLALGAVCAPQTIEPGARSRTGAALAPASTTAHPAEAARDRAPPGPPRPIEVRIDFALREAAKKRPFSGVLMVASADGVVTRTAGFADRAAGRPITAESRFVIGSLAKQVTAALVMREVEAGRVRLDDSIGWHVPIPMPWAEKVRVRHLLNHTRGVDDVDKPLKHEPGTAFEYSNLGYDLLGQLVERSSGRPFAAAVTDLFSRCGIARRASDDPGRDPLLVVGYGETTDGQLRSLALPPEARSHLASGGLVASATDVVQWSRCLHGGPAVSAESYERMTTPSTSRTHRWESLGYDFGLQVLDSEGLLEISHSGYVAGFVSTLIVYPKRCVTVVVLENVATSASDMHRAFAPHDAIRSEIRQILQNTPSNELGCAPVVGIAARR